MRFNTKVPVDIVGEFTGVIVTALAERSTKVALLHISNTVLVTAVRLVVGVVNAPV
jgi:hypothetical protein